MPAVMRLQVGGGTSGLDDDSSSPDDEDFRSIAFPPDDAIQKVHSTFCLYRVIGTGGYCACHYCH